MNLHVDHVEEAERRTISSGDASTNNTGRRWASPVIVALTFALALLLGPATQASAAAPQPQVASISSSVSHVGSPMTSSYSGRVADIPTGYMLCASAPTNMYVAAYFLGFCPSSWFLNYTPWGRSVSNWVTNVACKMPWYVWAATGGRTTKC